MGKRGKSDRNTVLLNYKLWLSSITGEGIISDGVYDLLIKIKEKGSLKAASDSCGISYRKAWGDIKNAEELLGYELTIRVRGGKSGGLSTLTSKALKLLEAYEVLHSQFNEAAEKAYSQFNDKINTP